MTEHTQRRPRAQYTSRACDECRRRKVKCSGSEPCQCCVAAQATCRYNHEGQRGARRVLGSNNRSQNNDRVSRPSQGRNATSIIRTSSLEKEIALMREGATSASLNLQDTQQQVPNSPPAHQYSRESLNTGPSRSIANPNLASRIVNEDENWFGQGSALLGTQNRVLKALSAGNSPNDEISPSNGESPVSAQGDDNNGNNVAVLISCTLSNNPRLAPMIRFFFTDHNSCFYCLDPDPFIARLSHLLEEFSSDNGQLRIPSNRPELLLLAALACMILALAEATSPDTPIINQENPSSFQTHQMWNTEARCLLELYPNHAPIHMDIVRFHLVATFYGTGLDCISQEPIHGSYQAIAMAITSAYSIGLNNEDRWGNVSREERTSRKLLWASIDLMDKQIAYKCGRPHLIRESEVVVSDLKYDIMSLETPAETDKAGVEKENGEPARKQTDNATSSATAPQPTSLSLSYHLKLQYTQALIEFTQLFTRAWKTFFSVRGPSAAETDEVQSIDALFLRMQRNFPPDLCWNTVQYLSSPKTKDKTCVFRIRLLLFTRINVLRLAIHHAAIRGRRGGPPLVERFSVAEYQYTLALCDEISCATLAALFAYLESCAPGICLTTYATAAALECIYHPIAIAQLAVADGMLSSCQLSGRMIATLAEAAKTFRKVAGCGSSNPSIQLPRSMLPLIEGILNQQKIQHPPLLPNGLSRPSSNIPTVLPSLKDQINSGASDYTVGMLDDVMLHEDLVSGEMAVDFNASYCFDPSLLPAAFLDNGRAFDFIGNDFFPNGYDLELEANSL